MTRLRSCLNLHLVDAGAVLRIHQPFESSARLLALRRLRRQLSRVGLRVGEPLNIDDHELVRWEGRWAELERFVAHVKPPPTWEWVLEHAPTVGAGTH